MIVLDSSFLVAYHNESDVNHDAALRLMERLVDGAWGDALLPEGVFIELVTVLAARRDVAVARTAGELLLDAREVELVPSTELFADAWKIFANQERFVLSFVDASIVALARQRGTPHVASFDRDFATVAGIELIDR